MSPKQVFVTLLGILALIIVAIVPFTVFYNVDAGEIVVHQDFSSGKLSVWRTPGIKWQGLGKVTQYPKSDEFEFLAEKNEKGQAVSTKDCLRTRFNDKGAAEGVCGQISFDLPLDDAKMKEVHEKYNNIEAIRDRIVRATMTKAVYHAGPLMSSKESAGERRGELITYMQDQAIEGIYNTEELEVDMEDLTVPPLEVVEMTDAPVLDENGQPKLDEAGKPVMAKKAHTLTKFQTKRVKVLVPLVKNGQLVVRERSVATAMGFKLHSFTIEDIIYETKVQAQIDRQRDMEMQIQTKIAEAESAKQDAITAEASGKADSAKAKWIQEVEKATVITKAQQAKEKASLDLETAALEKAATIERAEGEAKAKKLVMDADGALDKKLAAWKEVQKAYAAEWGKQPHVPSVVMGGSSSNSSGGSTLQDLLMLSAAKDIGLNYKP